jgi:hypothetical protein
MGKLAVHTKDGRKGTGNHRRTGLQVAEAAVATSRQVGRVRRQRVQPAAACRPRAGTGTELVYDGDKKFDPKKVSIGRADA